MASKSSESILALLAGAAIGVGIGILFAPDKGSNTRDKIKNSFDDLKDGVKSKFGSLKKSGFISLAQYLIIRGFISNVFITLSLDAINISSSE